MPDTPRPDASRRAFVQNLTAAGLGAMVVPRHVLGGPGYLAPSDKVNVAGIGIGGMGKHNVARVDNQNIVALCDVDDEYAAPVFKKYRRAARYRDYRRMLDEMGNQIDAVIVATPDHTHAVIALDAMAQGKHVYVQKPLTWSVEEARALATAAERTGVVTQMGNQGHSSDDARRVNEWIQAGAIGPVREVHVWTNRPVWWQGFEPPKPSEPIPETLDWDLYLGPAQQMTYIPGIHPFSWRGWVPFGTGALGDMGAHLLDHPFWALDLGDPISVETRATSFNGVSWPKATMTYYEFPARGAQPPVRLTWYDGGLRPPRPNELPDGEQLNDEGGVLYIGDSGKLLHETYGRNPRLLPEALHRDTPAPPRRYPRIKGENHDQNWIRAIRGEEEISAPFSYGAKLTEVMLLGQVSLHAGNRKLLWDAANMRFPNHAAANQHLRRDNRRGWELRVPE